MAGVSEANYEESAESVRYAGHSGAVCGVSNEQDSCFDNVIFGVRVRSVSYEEVC
jgi:hypothetical protein